MGGGDDVCVLFCYHALGSFMFGARWFSFSFRCTMRLCLCAYWPPFPKLHNRTVLVPIYDKLFFYAVDTALSLKEQSRFLSVAMCHFAPCDAY